MSSTSEIFLSAGVLLLLLALVVLFFLYRNVKRLGMEPRHSPEQDMAHMMILLQTMRDLLGDQKDLAKQLNQSVDRKVVTVKGMISEARGDHEKLREDQSDLARRAEALKGELESIQRRASFMSGPPPSPSPKPDKEATPDVKVTAFQKSTTPDDIEHQPHDASPDPLQAWKDENKIMGLEGGPLHEVIDAREVEDVGDTDLIDNWVGLDFGGDEPLPDAVEVQEIFDDSMEDPIAARMAFRDLTDMGEEDFTEQDGLEEGNGKSSQSTLRRRVYAYNDAGMAVAEISRELGIGKGEVRLILSLRQDKGD